MEMYERWIVLPGERFAQGAAHLLGQRLARRATEQGAVHVALSGGATPAPVYERLAGLELPWERIHVWFGDERRVPPDHADSNYRMVKETLLDRLPVEIEVHRLRGELEDGERAAAEYEAALPEVLDIALLGMGSDAHTASLFPGSPALREPARRVLAVAGPEGGHPRLTLTPPALRAARERIVLVAGDEKADMLREVFTTEPDPIRRPVQLALDGLWILDDAVAARLPGRS